MYLFTSLKSQNGLTLFKNVYFENQKGAIAAVQSLYGDTALLIHPSGTPLKRREENRTEQNALLALIRRLADYVDAWVTGCNVQHWHATQGRRSIFRMGGGGGGGKSKDNFKNFGARIYNFAREVRRKFENCVCLVAFLG